MRWRKESLGLRYGRLAVSYLLVPATGCGTEICDVTCPEAPDGQESSWQVAYSELMLTFGVIAGMSSEYVAALLLVHIMTNCLTFNITRCQASSALTGSEVIGKTTLPADAKPMTPSGSQLRRHLISESLTSGFQKVDPFPRFLSHFHLLRR